MTARVKPLIPAGEATELPDDEAWRALFDVFGAVDSPPTEPMPLELGVWAAEGNPLTALEG